VAKPLPLYTITVYDVSLGITKAIASKVKVNFVLAGLVPPLTSQLGLFLVPTEIHPDLG
jgi:hypothetical protein